MLLLCHVIGVLSGAPPLPARRFGEYAATQLLIGWNDRRHGVIVHLKPAPFLAINFDGALDDYAETIAPIAKLPAHPVHARRQRPQVRPME
jgi:hypothetical protein